MFSGVGGWVDWRQSGGWKHLKGFENLFSIKNAQKCKLTRKQGIQSKSFCCFFILILIFEDREV